MEALQQKLGYPFKNPALLRQALTHRSHGHLNNERLEFLGDSVLNCVVSQLLFERFSKIDEGDLSRLRANLVKQQSLYEIAQRLDLSGSLLLGDGELKSGGFRRPSILGDTLEAVIGAIFLDGGFQSAQTVISMLYAPVLKSVDPKTLGKDAKTLLQEHLQGRKISLPVYSVVATHGAAHNQLFEVECSIPKLEVQVLGNGGSRRAAEQAAAKLALERCLSMMPAPARRGRAKAGEVAGPVPGLAASASIAVAPLDSASSPVNGHANVHTGVHGVHASGHANGHVAGGPNGGISGIVPGAAPAAAIAPPIEVSSGPMAIAPVTPPAGEVIAPAERNSERNLRAAAPSA